MVKRIAYFIILVVIAIFSTYASASTQPVNEELSSSKMATSVAPPTKNTNTPIGIQSDKVSLLSINEFVLSLIVLLFGIFVIALQTIIIRKSEFNANDIVKIYGLSFIIIATLFIITAGYDSEQIAPAMGLFGTIAGYILGRNELGKKETTKEVSP
jgi:hypothetical protein